jgi:hypothetical protein
MVTGQNHNFYCKKLSPTQLARDMLLKPQDSLMSKRTLFKSIELNLNFSLLNLLKLISEFGP